MTLESRSSFLGIGLALLSSALATAQSDTWQNATTITDGLTVGNNLSATSTSPIGSCGFMGNDVWYSYVATCTGTATASTCAPGTASFDTVIAAWFGPLACGEPRPSELACDDDSCTFLRSTVTFAVQSGKSYYISVGGYQGATGTFTLSVSCSTAAGPAPANNLCANTMTVNDVTLLSGTNVAATSGLGDSVGSCGGMAKDVWYSFTASETGPYVATTCLPGTDYDTVLAVWIGVTCGTLLQIACNDDDCYLGGAGNLRSTVTFNAQNGGLYHVSVGGYLGASGYFNLKIGATGVMGLGVGSFAPGSIGFSVSHGPPNGTYFAAFTLSAGNFPNGWFLGIDISTQELIQQLTGGFPFWGSLTSCGFASVGPFTGLPSGLGLYGVAVGFTGPNGTPVAISPPDYSFVQ